ncbi:hypothetical protein U27_03468 [Candidatus Vecturithrix granuli]|uniref:Uncharacterized protein n=1 Tax=Vecturithrix granuli TaxID=1499967 RepID=A0A081BW01_VECG1|nr:hypothetical protein U27_03468 [Candidatus Vecturithrix granuli]
MLLHKSCHDMMLTRRHENHEIVPVNSPVHRRAVKFSRRQPVPPFVPPASEGKWIVLPRLRETEGVELNHRYGYFQTVSEAVYNKKAPQSLIMIAATIPAINGVASQPNTILIKVRLLTERAPTAIPMPSTAPTIACDVDTGTPIAT